MIKRDNLLTLLSTAFLVAITGQSATAFTLNYLSASGNVYTEYRTDNFFGYTWVALPEPVKRDSLEQNNLSKLLDNFAKVQKDVHGADWQFKFAENDLNGSFDFEYYEACGIKDKCGQERFGNDYLSNGVGASITLKYNPIGNDPSRLVGDRLYWIQRIGTDHALYPVDQHGVNENRLDDIRDGDTEPYYSQLGFSQIFGDTPYRTDYENDHQWDAELYLAQETREGSSRKVTIYNGVKWGWRNETLGRHVDLCPYPNVLECITNPPKNVPIDLAFVFDTTGSMGSYLNGVKSNFKNLAKDLFERVPGTRIAVVDYKDFPIYPYGGDGDYPYRAVLPFSSDISSIDAAINSLTTGGGGDTPESLLSALTRTIRTENLGIWRNGVRKAIIYLTDAPAHDPEPFTGFTYRSVLDEAFRVDPAIIYGIGPGYLSSDTSLAPLSSWIGGKLLSAQNSDDVTLKIIEALTHLNGAPITSSPIPSWYEYSGSSSGSGGTGISGGSGGGGISGGSGGGGRDTSPHTPSLTNYEDSKSPTSIPESTSTLGLLALGAWGIVKALKIRFNK